MFSSKTVLHIEMITIEDDGLHLIVETEVNDLKCRLLIDTGASRTVFDRTRIFNYVDEVELEDHEKLSTGLGTDSMPTSSTTLKHFKIGGIKIKNFHAILLDLSHVNSSYEKMGFSPIDGVLGSDVMNKYRAVIDYKKRRLTLND
jgi:predicted aspartyl protease